MDLISLIADMTDRAIPYILAAQVNDESSPFNGGQIAKGKGFAEPFSGFSNADTLLAAYFYPQSAYYKSQEVLNAAIRALEYLLNATHDDGTLDLLETNFHDATLNGFAMKILGYTHHLVKQHAKTTAEKHALGLISQFAEKSVEAMYYGGFHTPNHRWVMASGLAFCYAITRDERCIEMAELYLAEGIDCNEEGDYAERSAGIYDAVTNNALIIIAEQLGKPELLDYVRRNLNRLMYNIEPTGLLQTLTSRRQDYGKDASPAPHLWAYSFMAARDNNPQFAQMARCIQDNIVAGLRPGAPPEVEHSALTHHNLLTKLMLIPLPLPCPAVQETPLPLQYKKNYPLAGAARYRSGKLTITALKENSTCLKIQYGHLRVFCKLACTFFGDGRFLAQQLQETAEGFRLSSHVQSGYRRPLKDVTDPDWYALPHEQRQQANMQNHDWILEVLPLPADNAVQLRINTQGTPNIPWKLEFILDPGGMLYSGGVILPGNKSGWAVLGADAVYSIGGEYICINGGLGLHEYGPRMRNADPVSVEQFTLYHTGFTPARHDVCLTFGEGYHKVIE